MTRLSTGLRINSGKDDPSGMIAAAIQTNDIASMKQAITNTQNGSMLIGTADSALGQITNLLSNIRSLVTQVGNTAVVNSDMIAANQLQVDSALQAIDRISQVTKFQGQKILDGSLDFVNTAQSIPQIQNLNVSQANLGATGQLGVTVEINAHATQADITTSSGEKQATTRLQFAARAAVAADYEIVAKSNSSDYAGITIAVDAVGGPAAGTVSYNSNTKTLAVSGDATTTWSDIEALMAADPTLDALFTHIGAGAGLISVAGERTMNQAQLDITAVAKGIDFNNVKVTMKSDTAVAAATPTAVYNEASKELTITVDGTAGFADATALSAIRTAINGTKMADGVTDAFKAAFVGTSTGTELVLGSTATDTAAMANTSVSGYLNSAFSDSTRATGTITLATGGKIAFGGGAAGTLNIKANDLNQENNVKVVFLSDITKGNESATYTANDNTLTVHIAAAALVANASTMDNIIAAINGTGKFTAINMSGTASAQFFLDTDSLAEFNTTQDTITVESLNPGSNFNNMQVKFQTVDTLTGASASYDAANNVFLIKVKNSYAAADAVSLQTIADAISAVSGFAGSYHTANVAGSTTNQSASGVVFGAYADTTAVGNTGSTGGNTLLADLTFEIAGTDGQQVLTYKQGTSANTVAAGVNAVSDAVGITATLDNGLLNLMSSSYGANSLIAIKVISEGSTGLFNRALSSYRENGTNADATINGIQADSNGNSLSINTSSLAMVLDMQAETNGNFNFSITGGGAQFQLGPDVVSNQQLRIGIQSVNTARLGGANGKLYQLASGNNAALNTNPNLGAKIVDDAVTSITTLRGRLGAIQGLTMETNQKTLEDMQQNMETSLSLIQDTDFAAETANLTRAQILSQSGMAVLSIANQQPQQVLSLLPRG